jgi:hypothetical protein
MKGAIDPMASGVDPFMNERVQKYLDLSRKLREHRAKTGDVDCVEEDAILDDMDFAWAVLTLEDIEQVDDETNAARLKVHPG